MGVSIADQLAAFLEEISNALGRDNGGLGYVISDHIVDWGIQFLTVCALALSLFMVVRVAADTVILSIPVVRLGYTELRSRWKSKGGALGKVVSARTVVDGAIKESATKGTMTAGFMYYFKHMVPAFIIWGIFLSIFFFNTNAFIWFGNKFSEWVYYKFLPLLGG